MFITNHVLAGAIAGSVCKGRPVRAFAVGFATHVVMDMTPHWGNPEIGRDGFYAVAKRDGLLGLAALSIIAVAGVPPRTALSLKINPGVGSGSEALAPPFLSGSVLCR